MWNPFRNKKIVKPSGPWKQSKMKTKDGEVEFSPNDFIQINCKKCHGTGVYGMQIGHENTRTPIACSCIDKGVRKEMARLNSLKTKTA